MLQTSEISPFIYKNNVIRRLKFYWIKYKSQRSAVSDRRLAVGGWRLAVSGQRSAVSGQRSAVILPIPTPAPLPIPAPAPLLILPLANQPRAPLFPSCAPNPQTVADT